MNFQVRISIPYLWGDQTLQKNAWGFLNFLVGPNGTGKTLFAEQLKRQCSNQGLKPRYLNAERLTELEKQNYSFFRYSQMERGSDIGQFSTYKSQGVSYGLSAYHPVCLRLIAC
jgi:predicted AAA+ superfamily ATPase